MASHVDRLSPKGVSILQVRWAILNTQAMTFTLIKQDYKVSIVDLSSALFAWSLCGPLAGASS